MFFFIRGPAARRRRQRKTHKDTVGQSDFLSRNIGNLARRQRAFDRIYEPRTPSTDRLVDNVLSARDPSGSRSLSNMRVSLADSVPVATHVEENRVSSTVSVRKIRRTSIANANNMENPNGTKSTQINSVNANNNDNKSSATPRSAVTVRRVNKISNADETDKTDLDATVQEIPNVAPTVCKETAQVKVTKLPRIKSTKRQSSRAASADSVNVIHVNRSSLEMQPVASRSRTLTTATDCKANTSNGVTVTKISRKSITSEDPHT